MDAHCCTGYKAIGNSKSSEESNGPLGTGYRPDDAADAWKRTSVVTSKAAMRGQGKTGHARKPSRTSLFYTAAA